MPWKDPEQRRAAQKAYRQTPRGREVAQRSKDRFYAKRRAKHDDTPMVIDPSALASAMGAWRTA
jgi:hypothetical protein